MEVSVTATEQIEHIITPFNNGAHTIDKCPVVPLFLSVCLLFLSYHPGIQGSISRAGRRG